MSADAYPRLSEIGDAWAPGQRERYAKMLEAGLLLQKLRAEPTKERRPAAGARSQAAAPSPEPLEALPQSPMGDSPSERQARELARDPEQGTGWFAGPIERVGWPARRMVRRG